MRWRKLGSWPHEELWRGTVLRLLRSEWPHETPVDLMLIACDAAPAGFSLIVSTGYKAGAVLVQLPKAARAEGKVQAISRSWLLAHWDTQLYPACPVGAVRIIANYPPGVTIGAAR